jgi:hypothetical protein
LRFLGIRFHDGFRAASALAGAAGGRSLGEGCGSEQAGDQGGAQVEKAVFHGAVLGGGLSGVSVGAGMIPVSLSRKRGRGAYS